MKNYLLALLCLLKGAIPLDGADSTVPPNATHSVSDIAPASVTPAAPNPSIQVYENKEYGFSVEVPKDWRIGQKPFATPLPDGGAIWFLTIDNRRPDLNLKEMAWLGGQTQLPAELFSASVAKEMASLGGQTQPVSVAQQLLPGEIYIAMGLADLASTPLAVEADPTVKDLHALIAKNAFEPGADPGVSTLRLYFFRNGNKFGLNVYVREPVSREDWDRVTALLGSWQFVDAPVGNKDWARSLAWRNLPAEIRTQTSGTEFRFCTNPAERGFEGATAKLTGAGYEVTLTRFLGPYPPYRFLVTEKGVVTSLSPVPNLSPTPATADATDRHPIKIQVQAVLEAEMSTQRHNSSPSELTRFARAGQPGASGLDDLTPFISQSGLEPVEVLVDDKHQAGLTEEMFIYPEGTTRPATPIRPGTLISAAVANNRAPIGRSFFQIRGGFEAQVRMGTASSTPVSTYPNMVYPLKDGIKYVVEVVQTIFEVPDSPNPAENEPRFSGVILNGNPINDIPPLQLVNGPRQTLWTRSLKATFIMTGPVYATPSPGPTP